MEDEQAFRAELQRMSALLDQAAFPWAVAAGAGVYLYTRSRMPTDLDLLVRPEDLESAAARVESWIEPPKGQVELKGTRGQAVRLSADKVPAGPSEIVGRISIQVGRKIYPYFMDDEMVDRLRRVAFRDLDVPVLAPEDLIAFKAVAQRGREQGKHDLEDVAALAERLEIDGTYLRWRLEKMGALERALPVVGTIIGD